MLSGLSGYFSVLLTDVHFEKNNWLQIFEYFFSINQLLGYKKKENLYY